jgi:L-lactate utilization protein LutC
MKKSAPWWIAAGSVLFLPSAIAAELTVSNSSQLQEALSQAAASYEDDTIILLSPTSVTTVAA